MAEPEGGSFESFLAQSVPDRMPRVGRDCHKVARFVLAASWLDKTADRADSRTLQG